MNRPLHPCIDPACAECRGDGYLLVRDGERARAEPCGCLERYIHPRCPDCGGKGVVSVKGSESRSMRCPCRGRCPICRGTGFIAEDPSDHFSRRRRCTHGVLGEALARFNRAGLPARFAAAASAPFRHRDEAQLVALSAALAVLRDFDRSVDNRGLVLHGPVGRGKTHLLAFLVRRLIFEKQATVRFVEFSHLLADLKASFDRGTPAAALVDPLVEVDVLVVDELGKGRCTEWELTVIDELVSRRYNAGRAILASTNFEPGAATGRRNPNNAMPAERVTLADRVGERVYSRLREVCEFVDMPGSDYRRPMT